MADRDPEVIKQEIDHARDQLAATVDSLTERANPRRSTSDTVIYHLEGGTIQDLFVATWGYRWARERGLGAAFDLSA